MITRGAFKGLGLIDSLVKEEHKAQIPFGLGAAIKTSAVAPKYAKTGCNDTCGNVMIPYPFGIGASCSVNEWYVVDCISSTPYLHKLNQLQVLSVDLENQTVIVNMPRISNCSQTDNIDLDASPFLFSKSDNKFVFQECGNAVMMDHGRSLTGCSTTCGNDSVSDMNNCVGISCCETTLPYDLKSYNMNVSRGDRACRSAFLVDKRTSLVDSDYVPVSLLWTLSDSDQEKITCCLSFGRSTVNLVNGTSFYSWFCPYSDHWNLKGNPYLEDGCEARFETEECARCEDAGGFCYYAPLYGVDGLLHQKKVKCCSSSSRVEVDLGNGTSVDYLKCLSIEFREVKGNPYANDGIQDTEECAKCRDSGGSCYYDRRYDVDGLLTEKNFTCDISSFVYYDKTKAALPLIIGVSVTIGVLLLIATMYVLYKEGTKDDLLALANLAMRCLNLNGKYRPTMKEIAAELETIRTSHIPTMVQINIRP
ncbi:hypothetical protein QVD17_37358 [Tagetes erecta]|uniref:Wall-associated receptor kinase galacturonan-binding domain-containing protein n=1 Tax=Tagetes erecta TaxID=13708 RepID=A0AAD8JVW0_TARER|nr:hypothetical protein QVD17_37358 [Tagetes erecta]